MSKKIKKSVMVLAIGAGERAPWLNLGQIHERLIAAGYTDVREIERERDGYEVKARNAQGAWGILEFRSWCSPSGRGWARLLAAERAGSLTRWGRFCLTRRWLPRQCRASPRRRRQVQNGRL